ncbi:MAG: LUD domain-containing protein [Bacteroidota bacterium]
MKARENILSRIKSGLAGQPSKALAKPDFLKSNFAEKDELKEVVFAENFTRHNENFFYCEGIEEFLYAYIKFHRQREIKELFVWDTYLQKLLQVGRIDFNYDNEGIDKIEASLNLCELLVARTGSILVSSHSHSGRQLHFYPSLHIVLAFTSQLVYHTHEALDFLKKKYPKALPSWLTFINSPAQNSDIENINIYSGHGPKEIALFLIDDQVQDSANSNV